MPLPPCEAQRGQEWPETWEKVWEENQEEVQKEEEGESDEEGREEPRARSQACRRQSLGTGPALSLSGGQRCSVRIRQSDSEQEASTAQMQTQKAPHKSRVQVEQLSRQRSRDQRTETAEEISRDPGIPGTDAACRLKGVSSLLQEGAPSPPPVLPLPLKRRASLRCRQAQAGRPAPQRPSSGSVPCLLS